MAELWCACVRSKRALTRLAKVVFHCGQGAHDRRRTCCAGEGGGSGGPHIAACCKTVILHLLNEQVPVSGPAVVISVPLAARLSALHKA